MNEGRLDVGVVNTLDAEAFGDPGQRTFRLRATTDSGEVSLWLEKEQMVALGAAVLEILERVPEGNGLAPRPVQSKAQITGEVAAHAGSLALGFDTSQNAFAIEASELWEATLDVQRLLLLANREQLTVIESQVEEIVAAGRPRCPMCGRPMGPDPHFCPPSNGHARVLGKAAE